MLRRRVALGGALCLVATLALSAPVQARAPLTGADRDPDRAEVYVGQVQVEQMGAFRKLNLDHEDVASSPAKDGKVAVEAILSPRQAKQLARMGVVLSVKQVRGEPASRALSRQATHTVYRSYSQPGGIRDELVKAAADHPAIAKLVTVGHSVKGQPIYAVKVSHLGRWLPDGLRPSVLYMGTQHAREWITPEMVRRLMHQMLYGYHADPEIRRLVQTRELWFLPVANPDGYDFTFTPENRLWRKNLRDNDGDGQIGSGDGVDPNRNYATHWGYDDEGSSPDPSNDTYRGPAPASEPETRAIDSLARRVKFEFAINYHSAAELLLYGVGYQVSTDSPDDVLFEALLGDDAHPAVPGYDPDVAAELYTTNGETTEHLSERYGVLAITPEMSTCQTVSALDPNDQWLPEDCASGFTFPDDEKLIEQEFRKNVPLALAMAKSAGDPDDPVSVVGRSTPDFEVDAFDVSYGGQQTVAAVARRSLINVRAHYRINGGPERTSATSAWKGGERYGDANNRYFAEVRGKVTGARAGDRVEVWFSGIKVPSGRVTSSHFTYTVASDIGGEVLILAAEDVTGISPAQGGTSAKYADEVAASLSAAGYSSDVYDFDVQGRKAPHHLGVLSHYRAVVWETGDDVILRAPGQVPGTAAKAALDIEVSVRDYLNEGGKLLVGGQYALFAQAGNAYAFNPFAPPECTTPNDYPCIPLLDDFLQYWLGAYTYVSDGGTNPDGDIYALTGNTGAFRGFAGQPNAPGSAGNQGHSASFLATSSFLPPAQFPHFGGSGTVDWVRPGGAPFDPHGGSWYVYSGRSDVSYKRLSRTVDLTSATSGSLGFFASYDTEPEWDYLFVEAREVGTQNWTTLPDANGHTTSGTGDSCASGWRDLHPQLNHYQGADCSATGSTGTWHAASGPSGGWQEWSVDLTAFAGKQVEVSISYASDWATQGLGVFVDDTKVIVNGATVAQSSFEDGLDGWTVAAPPAGSPATPSYTRTQSAFDEGAVVVTRDTVFAGFGLEGLEPAARNDFVARSMRHLLGR